MKTIASWNNSLTIPCLIFCLAVFGCAVPKKEYIERPVEELYNEALDHVEKGFYSDAVASFEEVERQHPYSVWATKAQLMSAYVSYMANRYDEAILSLDRFIQLHPSNREVAYAMYLKGLSYYEQISDVSRDQKVTELSLNAFKELISLISNLISFIFFSILEASK